MKMNLDMSFEEGMKVVSALRECAIKNGWDEDELDESGVMEEYTAAVDAALTAMGISISIASEPEVEDDDENKYCDSATDCSFCNSDDEEWDEDEEDGYFDSDDDDDEEDDGDTTAYFLTAKGEFVVRYMEAGHSFKEACAIADLLFGEGEGE